MLNKIIFIILILANLSLYAQGQILEDSETPILEWEEVPKVKNYQLQIRNEAKDLILDQKTSTTRYDLKFKAGKYEHRVGVYNKFGKIANFSEWVPFAITQSLPPIINGEKKIYSSKKEQTKTIVITGKNFYKRTKAILKKNSKLAAIKKIEVLNDETIQIEVDNDTTEIGDYDLKLENPRNKNLEVNDYYILRELDKQIAALKEKVEKQKETAKVLEEVTAKYPYWKAGLRSAVLPGWGQYSKDEKRKAIILDAVLLLSFLNLYNANNEFESQKEKYSKTVVQGVAFAIAANSQALGVTNIIITENSFQRTEEKADSVRNASLLLALVYLVNVSDALFWKVPPKTALETEKSIKLFSNFYSNPWQETSSSNSQIELGLKYKF
ncbi:MAG: DUF5683 domain-containing protein [Leptospiraceae bacterium]|nr:DUF5683 domain-containing protein [Leptospiraceae bacterium]